MEIRMPRELTGHQVNGCNEAIKIEVEDEPGRTGACHQYVMSYPCGPSRANYLIRFQNGPIKEVGTNGITHEALLAILIDRLEGFQSGPYACPENGMALSCLHSAQRELKSRTEARIARGVEGTHEK
jgi:hypothetical protein